MGDQQVGGVLSELQGAAGAGAGLGWRAQLPDDLKDHEAFTPFKTVGDFGKAYLDTTGKVNDLEGRLANSIPKPGDNASPEDLARYFTELGRPSKDNDYQFESLQLPDGMPSDPAFESDLKKIFFEAGLSSGQAKVLHKYLSEKAIGNFNSLKEQALAKMEADKNEQMSMLDKNWGDKKEVNMNLIKKVLNAFGNEGMIRYLDITGEGNQLDLIEFFLKVGNAISEDSFPGGSGRLNTNDVNTNKRLVDDKTGMTMFDYPSMREEK